MDLFKELRQKMVKEQIASRGIHDQKVLEAMATVPREMFLDSLHAASAYQDGPLPIEEGQTISQPFIVALMAEQAEIKAQDKVLEVGTGSGYSAAILSQLCAHVFSIERYSNLAEVAQQRLQALSYNNIKVSIGDGTLGWEEFAPYDVIIVTASGPSVPSSLLKQLVVGGRLIMPIGPNKENQELIRVRREDEKGFSFKNLGSVRFVPLIGQEAWPI